VSSKEAAEHIGHVLSVNVLVATGAMLLVLTAITIAVAQVDLGNLNIVVAMGIAATKATIVALIFMHLRYGSRFNSVVLACSVFFAAFMIGFVVFDTTEYQGGIRAYEQAVDAAGR
jgi:cytochrome c oxidase subunit 4